jgi:branched-chain amino acid transport system substrate-binding protein
MQMRQGSEVGTNRLRKRSLGFLLLVALLVAACAGDGSDGGEGEVDEVRLVAVLPLSGLFAESGRLVRLGAEMAVEEINEQGGIESLGGANLVLDVHDAGEEVESAVSAATRALTEGEKPAGGIGSYLSSLTLGVTEVAQRQGVPWMTLSFADEITDRGFDHVYQTSAVSSQQAEVGLQQFSDLLESEGESIDQVALVGDNTAAAVGFFEPIEGGLASQFGWEVVANETWTPPLSDGTPIARSLRSAEPDAILYVATNFSDSSQILRANEQFGVEVPYLASGSWIVTPPYLEGVGEDAVDGIMAIVGSHPLKGQEDLVERFSEFSDEPFMIQDSVSGYFHMWIFKEALEQAGSADPAAVNDALKELELTEGPAAETVPPGEVRFEENGRLAGAIPIIVQWQNGEPVTVFPPDIATSEPRLQ